MNAKKNSERVLLFVEAVKMISRNDLCRARMKYIICDSHEQNYPGGYDRPLHDEGKEIT